MIILTVLALKYSKRLELNKGTSQPQLFLFLVRNLSEIAKDPQAVSFSSSRVHLHLGSLYHPRRLHRELSLIFILNQIIIFFLLSYQATRQLAELQLKPEACLYPDVVNP